MWFNFIIIVLYASYTSGSYCYYDITKSFRNYFDHEVVINIPGIHTSFVTSMVENRKSLQTPKVVLDLLDKAHITYPITASLSFNFRDDEGITRVIESHSPLNSYLSDKFITFNLNEEIPSEFYRPPPERFNEDPNLLIAKFGTLAPSKWWEKLLLTLIRRKYKYSLLMHIKTDHICIHYPNNDMMIGKSLMFGEKHVGIYDGDEEQDHIICFISIVAPKTKTFLPKFVL